MRGKYKHSDRATNLLRVATDNLKEFAPPCIVILIGFQNIKISMINLKNLLVYRVA